MGGHGCCCSVYSGSPVGADEDDFEVVAPLADPLVSLDQLRCEGLAWWTLWCEKIKRKNVIIWK